MGRVSWIVPAGELDAFVHAQARTLSTLPSTSLQETKKMMKKVTSNAVKAKACEEMACFATMLEAPAAKEAMTAFLEKRMPDFGALS